MAGQRTGLLGREGRWYARKVIPAELRPYFDGKRELRKPLGPDRRGANARLAAAMAEFEAEIAVARRKHEADRIERVTGAPARYPLTSEQTALAHYASELDLDMKERVFPDRDLVPDMSWSKPAFRKALIRAAAGTVGNEEMAALVGWAIDAYADRGNHAHERGSQEWRALGMALAAAQLEAIGRQGERDEGNFAGEPVHPMLRKAQDFDVLAAPVSLTLLLDEYLKERGAAGRDREARRKWTPTIADFVSFVGHDDARRISKADILKWKDAKLEAGLAAATFKRGHFAALNAVLRWAHENDRIDINPADGVRLRVSTPIQTREKGFRDDEAAAVLQAAKTYVPPLNEEPKLAAAKRWVPWLCAFTGARIGETVQLRREDILQTDGMHVIRITPAAGTVKTGVYRDVPIHQQLIDDGFLDQVGAIVTGPLFLTVNESKNVLTASRTLQNRIREWAKNLRLVPDGVNPFHGWRHRFKTVGRELGIDTIVLDAIQGHARRSAGDNYGDITLKAKHRAIAMLPRQ